MGHKVAGARTLGPAEAMAARFGTGKNAVGQGYSRPPGSAAPTDRQRRFATTNPARILGRALIDGHDPTAPGIPIAAHYHVIAIATGRISEISIPRPGTMDHDENRQRQLESGLTARFGDTALMLLSSRGGTVLLPSEVDEKLPDNLMPELSQAIGGAVSAAAVRSPTAAIPHAAELAHDLLDIVLRLGYTPGLYTLGDLTLEYQLTRPGPATTLLTAPLEPILTNPELLDTLRSHVADNFSRQKTAETLNIHRNTVDYRLRRIKDLTGLDPHNQSDRLRLHSALIIHTYRTRPERPR